MSFYRMHQKLCGKIVMMTMADQKMTLSSSSFQIVEEYSWYGVEKIDFTFKMDKNGYMNHFSWE